MLFRCIARSLPTKQRKQYDGRGEELKDVIVYLQGRIEELESKKMCECAEEPIKPTVTYATNYDEDEECISCSA